MMAMENPRGGMILVSWIMIAVLIELATFVIVLGFLLHWWR